MSKFWIKMGTESKGAFSFKKQKRKRQRKTEELHGEGERGWMGQRGFHGEGERVWRGQGSSWRRSDRLEVLCHWPRNVQECQNSEEAGKHTSLQPSGHMTFLGNRSSTYIFWAKNKYISVVSNH